MEHIAQKLIEVGFYGGCHVRLCTAGGGEIKSAKHRAMIALLVTAFDGRRSRKFLQETLWASARHDGGSQSLRRALSDLRLLLGDTFNQLFNINNADIQIQLDRVGHLTDRSHGEFLEGLDIREAPFQEWLARYKSSLPQVPASDNIQALPRGRLEEIQVAIIPFRLVYGDSQLAVLADVIAEDISRGLSRSRLLSVISPLSTRQLVEQELSLEVLRGELNADYVVVGGIRGNEGKVSLDVDFMDTRTGQMYWTRRLEWKRSGNGFYDPEIITEICRAIGRTIVNETIDSIGSQTLERIEDHRLLIAGISLMHKQSFSGFLRGKVMLDEVQHRNPGHAEIYAWLAKWYVMRVINGWTIDRVKDSRMALEHSDTSLELAPESPFALTINGLVHSNLLRKLEIAVERYQLALKINSNESLAWLLNGTLLSYTGDTSEAVRQVERAHSLSPLDPFGYFYDSLRATTHFADGNYKRALELADRSYANNPRHSSTLRVKIASLHYLGRQEEARKIAHELKGNEPNFTISQYLATHPASEFKAGKMMVTALLSAGISQ